MKARKQTETIANQNALQARLIELSQDGQAWVYAVLPFTHEVAFASFRSPCRVPDEYMAHMGVRKIAYKGKLVDFTQAAVIREQDRSVTCE